MRRARPGVQLGSPAPPLGEHPSSLGAPLPSHRFLPSNHTVPQSGGGLGDRTGPLKLKETGTRTDRGIVESL